MLMFLILAVAVLVFGFLSSRYSTNHRFAWYIIIAMYNLCLSVLVFNDSTDLKILSFTILLLTGAYNYRYLKKAIKTKDPGQ